LDSLRHGISNYISCIRLIDLGREQDAYSYARMAYILAHNCCELTAGNVLGRNRTESYEKLFKDVFNKRTNSDYDKKRSIEDCRFLEECLLYELTLRMLQMTNNRNSYYHQGGAIQAFRLYDGICDTLSYIVNITGIGAFIEIYNKASLLTKFFISIFLDHFLGTHESLIQRTPDNKKLLENLKNILQRYEIGFNELLSLEASDMKLAKRDTPANIRLIMEDMKYAPLVSVRYDMGIVTKVKESGLLELVRIFPIDSERTKISIVNDEALTIECKVKTYGFSIQPSGKGVLTLSYGKKYLIIPDESGMTRLESLLKDSHLVTVRQCREGLPIRLIFSFE